MIDLIRGKTILVVGMARSGLAASRLLAELGAAKVVMTDRKPLEQLSGQVESLKKYCCIEAVTGGTPPELVTAGVTLVIKSPGVPPDLEIFRRAAAMKIPVLSEIELAYAFIRAPLIGITGSNGKTTTTALTAAILEESRFAEVLAAGNIGLPLVNAVGRIGQGGIIVAELSSFQLEDIHHFRPAVAVILNFVEDHLDYHGSIDNYFRAKARILENQTGSDFAVLNAGDQAVASLSHRVRGRLLWFDRGRVSEGAGLENGNISLFGLHGGTEEICPASEIKIPLENALAAAAAAWAAGADPPSIGKALRAFRGLEHRLELCASINGVDFINDSKGTNPGATMAALRTFPGRRKILIAGGKEKGSNFTELAEVIAEEVDCLVLLGETREKLAAAARAAGFHRYCLVDSLEEAVIAAWARARPGDLVLLSPACASWDMFTDYEARGNLFKQKVALLRSSDAGSEVAE